ncbi:MAG: hypothetical protein R3B45_00665 [Bdellovibrionota bacterium]
MKLLNFYFLLLVLLPFNAQASETRTRVIGHDSVRDNTDLFSFPSTAVNKNFVLVELGTSGQTQAYGLISHEANDNQFAIALSHEASLFTAPDYGSSVSVADAWLSQNTSNSNDNFLLPYPERPIDIIYARKVGKNSFGLGLSFANYVSKSDHDSGPKDMVKSEATQIGLTLGFSKLESAFPLDIALTAYLAGDLERNVESAASTRKNSYDESGQHFLFLARSINHKSHYALLRIESRKAKLTNETASADESATINESAINLSGGAILNPIKSTLVYAGLDFITIKSKGPTTSPSGENAVPSFASSDEEIKIDTNALGAAIGLETKVSESFGILGGLNYTLWGTITKDDNISSNEPTTKISIFETSDASLWALGLFYENNDLRIDASYANSFLFAGPYLISGNDRGGNAPLFTQLSLTYSL